jgi:hypothetical protein
MVKVKFKHNGFETEMKEETAKVYEKKGKVEIIKGKPGPKPKSQQTKSESTEKSESEK